jgi:hypothetical protein
MRIGRSGKIVTRVTALIGALALLNGRHLNLKGADVPELLFALLSPGGASYA